jgi:hypothetical protein
MVHDISVDRFGLVGREQLRGVLGAVGDAGEQFDLRAELPERLCDVLDVAREVVSDVRPGGTVLLDREAGEDQADAWTRPWPPRRGGSPRLRRRPRN